MADATETPDAPDAPDAGAGDETAEHTSPRRAGRGRRIIAWVLIVLASFLAFGVAADVWVKRQMLSTTQWVKLSDKILAEPKVQAALSAYLVDEIYANVDVQQALSDQLPDNLKGISGPLAGALRGPATQGVEKILASSQVKAVWHEVNTVAHRSLVAVLEDKMTTGSSKNGQVTLDLGVIVTMVAEQIGLPAGIVDKIPADVGQITIFQSDQLALVQKSVAAIRVLGPVLVLLVLAMYAGAVWLNRGRRIRTLRNIGWSIVVVGLLLVILRKVLGNYVVSMIPSPQYVPTGGLVWAIVTDMIRQIGWVLVSWGGLIVLGMLYVGPSRAARRVRHFLAPAVNSDPAVFWIGAGVLYLLAVWTSPSPALQVWWSVLLVAALGAAFLEVVRRRSKVEFPDAAFHVEGLSGRANSAWGSVSGWARSVTSRDGSGGTSADPAEGLSRLAALHDAGALSDEEYAAAKAKLLG